jgi:hypothetical protein
VNSKSNKSPREMKNERGQAEQRTVNEWRKPIHAKKKALSHLQIPSRDGSPFPLSTPSHTAHMMVWRALVYSLES